MATNNRKFSNEAYEKFVASLAENNNLIQILADSGLTYDLNSDNLPENFYVRDGEYNKVEPATFKIFGQEIKVPVRTIKQKLPNGDYKEFRMIECEDGATFFESAESIMELAEIITDDQVAARAIYPNISSNIIEGTLGDDYALAYEGLVNSTNPAKQKDLMVLNDFNRLVKGSHVLFNRNAKFIYKSIKDIFKNDRGASSDEDRKRYMMANSIGSIATTDWNTDANPTVVNLNNSVIVKSVPTFGNILNPANGNSTGFVVGNNNPINIPQVNTEAPATNTQAPTGKPIKRK